MLIAAGNICVYVCGLCLNQVVMRVQYFLSISWIVFEQPKHEQLGINFLCAGWKVNPSFVTCFPTWPNWVGSGRVWVKADLSFYPCKEHIAGTSVWSKLWIIPCIVVFDSFILPGFFRCRWTFYLLHMYWW